MLMPTLRSFSSPPFVAYKTLDGIIHFPSWRADWALATNKYFRYSSALLRDSFSAHFSTYRVFPIRNLVSYFARVFHKFLSVAFSCGIFSAILQRKTVETTCCSLPWWFCSEVEVRWDTRLPSARFPVACSWQSRSLDSALYTAVMLRNIYAESMRLL